MRNLARWALSALVAAAMSSCTTLYYNASVLGHESIESPLVKDGTHEIHVKAGGTVRGGGVNNNFTGDSMRAVQFSLLTDVTFPLRVDSIAFDLNTGISWYNAITSAAPFKMPRQSYSGQGLSFQLRPGFLVKLGETTSGMLYGKWIYDRESGDYKDFRNQSLLDPSATSGAIDESPSGSTLSVYFGGQLQFLLNAIVSLDFGGELGSNYSEWPNSHKGTSDVGSFNLFGTLSFYNFWVYASYENLMYLSSGYALGVGCYLF